MWIPLMDYAVKKNVSLSTLRRYIKSNKVRYKVESGKYLLFCEDDGTSASLQNGQAPSRSSNNQILAELQPREPLADQTRLQAELSRAQEEIAELKMLIAIYEENISSMRPNA